MSIGQTTPNPDFGDTDDLITFEVGRVAQRSAQMEFQLARLCVASLGSDRGELIVFGQSWSVVMASRPALVKDITPPGGDTGLFDLLTRAARLRATA